jgi:hypothetical protein
MDNPAAISPFQPFAQMFGGQQGVTPSPASPTSPGGVGGGINNMISALMQGYNNTQNANTLAPNAGTYEGNIQTPANPLGSVTPPAMPPAASPGMPPPQTGGVPMPPPRPPMNPFTQGASPTPFLNGSALFGQLPQRPNPISSMQL